MGDRRDWRSLEPMPAEPEWWFLDGPSWRALVRVGPAGAAEGLVVALVGLTSLAGDASWATVAQEVGRALGIPALALLAVIALLNRPAPLVAPRFRLLPGALEEWRHGDERPPRDD